MSAVAYVSGPMLVNPRDQPIDRAAAESRGVSAPIARGGESGRIGLAPRDA